MEELKLLIEGIGAAFEEYKTTNDARLKEMERGGEGGEQEKKLVAIEAKLQELEAKRGELEAKLNRPGLAGGVDADEAEYSKLFDGWTRKGEHEGELKAKDVNLGTGSEGGLAVPSTLDRNVYALLVEYGPMRRVCGHLSIGGEQYSQLVDVHGATGGWVGEKAARPKTDTPSLTKIEPIMGELYAFPQATQRSLDDMFFDVEGWLSGEIASTFAIMENTAFTKGDGTDKPKGLFSAPTAITADGTRPFGTLQMIKTGVDGAFGEAPGDVLIDVTTSLKNGHRNGAVWMMNRLTEAAIRKFKDKEGNYLWQPGLQAGKPNVLMGYGLVINDDMDGMAKGKSAIAFGNFASAYVIVDRIGIRMLRDPFTNKPYIGFYATKRVGGMLKDSEAVKLLNFAV